MVSENSVAIIGVGGIFPESPTLGRFWDNIAAKIKIMIERFFVPHLLEKPIFDKKIICYENTYSFFRFVLPFKSGFVCTKWST